ncbi:MAG TPA: DUF1501 domain-containing protein [Terriglobia bacterium]|nr:DUF1501 domain-containing protein [Terriglobia bacterium]
MAVTRRFFLKASGLSLFGAGVVPSFMRRTAFALPGKMGGGRKVLVAIFQRGAVDGLNMVIPFGEKDYFSMRPTIAIPEPHAASAGDGAATAVDLDGFFGLHPSLASMQPLFDAKQLAVVHAVGSPDNTRSHFDAQDYMETATPGVKSTRDGWLNRYLHTQPEAGATPFRAVALGSRMPLTLAGRASSLVLDEIKNFRLLGTPDPRPFQLPTPAAEEDAFEEMYASSSDSLFSKAAAETFEAIRTLRRIGGNEYQPANGARYPQGRLGTALQQVAQLIKADVGLEAAFADVGGWDTHVNQGGVEGQLANNLKQLGDALAAFHKDLGGRMENVVVLTMSEFGRTARENGNRGTDHGHANAMFVLGGPVKGGRVYGRWPGLKPGQLHQDRDLALTTDFRDVFAEVAVRHLGARDIAQIFPGYAVSPANFKGFLG